MVIRGYKRSGMILMILFLMVMIIGLVSCGNSDTEKQSEDDTITVTIAPIESATIAPTEAIIIEPTKALYEPVLPVAVTDAEIFVEKIEGISDEFIRGVDISSILAEEESGVKYYDVNGNEEDIFKILADAGVNYIRVRVWNDPYDAAGNGYGGGTNDTAKAAIIGKRAAEYGMKLLVDYQYSDFWADPSKQQAPKAWADMTLEEMADAVYTFTKESLNEIIAAGANVGMVQMGNETNNGMAGYTVWKDIAQLMNGASNAIYEVAAANNMDILVAIHLTNPEDTTKITTIIDRLLKREVKFDVVALSYYSYWHGSLENLSNIMNTIVSTYGKQVLVTETSYAYTLLDGDGHTNSVDEQDLSKDYTASVQSQANAVRDVMATVAGLGDAGLGVFYWEPAWIPVEVYDYEAADAVSVLESNKSMWEKYGSGWASSFATEYDPEDAGVYFGGSSWDNQAMFDFTGHPLASLNVFKYVKYGATAATAVDFTQKPSLDVNVGSAITLPETVYVVYNNRSLSGDIEVIWNDEQLAAIDTNVIGDYTIEGALPDGTIVTCDVSVALMNWVTNASFEEEDRSMYNIVFEGTNPADYQVKETDAYTGTTSLHFYSTDEVYFQAEQTITGLEDGEYFFSIYAQGGDVGEKPEMYIYATSGDVTVKADFKVDGWCVWQNPGLSGIQVTGGTVTVGVYIKCAAKGWGTVDDLYLCKLN